MSRNKGLDHGYLYTKDNEFRIFRSAFNKSGVTMGSSAFITIDGVDYSVGAGDRNVAFDKSDSEMNKVTTLTNLSLTGSNDYNLVVGLPIGQYKTQKDKFRKMIMAYNDSEVIFQGKQMDLKINDVYVLPQGIGALLSLNEINGNVIIIDWGGLTIDIAYIEVVYGNPILHKFDTWTNGIQKIYSKLINAVNEKYNLTRDITFAENILVNGLFINGEKVALDFLISTVREYIDPIVTELKINYPVANTPIYMTGGTSTIGLVTDMFRTYFPHAKLMPNSQFANAIGYGKVAEQKFGAISIPVCNYRR